MPIYDPDKLVKSGFKGVVRYTGTCKDVREAKGNFGDQLVVEFEEIVVGKHEDPNVDVESITKMTEYYKISSTVGGVWEHVLKAYQKAGMPLPQGPLNKRFTLERVHLEFGKDREGKVLVSEPRLPVSGAEAVNVAESPADYTIPEEMISAAVGLNLPGLKRWVAQRKMSLPKALVDDTRSGEIVGRLSEVGVKVDEDGVFVEAEIL